LKIPYYWLEIEEFTSRNFILYLMYIHPLSIIIACFFIFLFSAGVIVAPITIMFFWLSPVTPTVLGFDFQVNHVQALNATTIFIDATGNWTIKYEGNLQIKVLSMNAEMSYGNLTIGTIHSNASQIIYPFQDVKVYTSHMTAIVYLTTQALITILEDLRNQKPIAFHFEGELEIVIVSQHFHPKFSFTQIL
jgi:hypothetical protein